MDDRETGWTSRPCPHTSAAIRRTTRAFHAPVNLLQIPNIFTDLPLPAHRCCGSRLYVVDCVSWDPILHSHYCGLPPVCKQGGQHPRPCKLWISSWRPLLAPGNSESCIIHCMTFCSWERCNAIMYHSVWHTRHSEICGRIHYYMYMPTACNVSPLPPK